MNKLFTIPIKVDGDKMRATFMQRLLAYLVDIVVISVIVSIFTFSFDNSKLEEINTELNTAMNDLMTATSGGSEASELNMDEINQKITDLEYDYQKATVLQNSISVVIYILYFIVFQFLYKGQTLGKKLLKIRVVTKEEKQPTLGTFVIRGIIVEGILATFLSLIAIVVLSKDNYLTIYTWLSMLSSTFIVASALMVLYRKDRRGLHDMMAKTIVIKEEK